MHKKRTIKKDYKKIEKSLSKTLSFSEKQKYFKVQLLKNYNDKECKYTEKDLLKRLQFLEHGLGLYQSFYISVVTGLAFFGISVCFSVLLSQIPESITEISQHQYMSSNRYWFCAVFLSKYLKTGMTIIVLYALYLIYIYCSMKSNQNKFNKYQTNDFEIDLLKKKLNIYKDNNKRDAIKLKRKRNRIRNRIRNVR